jgi:hypothetical protein
MTSSLDALYRSTTYRVGISLDEAVALGRRFGQNAIVAGRCGAAAELVYCT